MTLGGDGPEQLHRAEQGMGVARWSPDGSSLAVLVAEGILVVNVEQSSKDLVWSAAASVGPVHDLVWSPDGSAFALSITPEGAGNREIFRLEADGSGLRNLTKTADVDENHPRWEPGGDRIVFVRQPSVHVMADFEVWTMNGHGSDQTFLAPGTAPQWSPDGKRIAFDDNVDVWIMERDGGNVRKLTAAEERFRDGCDRLKVQFIRPQWAPSSDRLVLTSVSCGGLDLWTLGIGDSDPVRLTEGGQDRAPRWSPDGEKILFQDGRNIRVIDLTTGETRMVSRGDRYVDRHASWRP